MQTLFVAGSIAISRIHPDVRERIANAVDGGMAIVVGDADGADTAIQEVLADLRAERVTVYCSGDTPRNNVANWRVESVFPDVAPGTRAWFTAKDIAMASVADYGLMIWDARSTGTLSNVIELLGRGRTSVVFVNKDRRFLTVGGVDALSELVGAMSPTALDKAERKMRLSRRIANLRDEQFAMPL